MPRRRGATLPPAGGLLALGLLVGCRDPTQVTLEISTDAPCVEEGPSAPVVTSTAIVTGSPTTFREAARAPAAVTTQCREAGDIGTLVVTPSDGKDAQIGVRVLVGVRGRSAEECAAQCGPDCIEATRRVGFIPHTPLRLPIAANRSCIGVCCPVGETCIRGDCVDDAIDACGEDEDCEPARAPGSVIWSRHFGGPGNERITSLDERAGKEIAVVGDYDGDLTLGTSAFPTVSEKTGFIARLQSAPFFLERRRFCNGADIDLLQTRFAGTRLLTLGTSTGDVDCGRSVLPTSAQSYEFLVELNSSFDIVNEIRFGGAAAAGRVTPTAIAAVGDGVVVAGRYTGTPEVLAGGTPLASPTSDGVFVAKLQDDDLSETWVRSFHLSSPAGRVSTHSIEPRVAVAGEFRGTIDLPDGTSLTASDGQDVFFVDLSREDGTVNYAEVLSGPGDVTLHGHIFSTEDGLGVAVSFGSTLDVGSKTLTAPAGSGAALVTFGAFGGIGTGLVGDGFTAGHGDGGEAISCMLRRRADTNEAAVFCSGNDDPGSTWARPFPGSADAVFAGLEFLSDDALVAGTFTGSLTIGETFASRGGSDVFLARLAH